MIDFGRVTLDPIRPYVGGFPSRILPAPAGGVARRPPGGRGEKGLAQGEQRSGGRGAELEAPGRFFVRIGGCAPGGATE